MKHIVSIGGGIASTLALPLYVASRYDKRDIELVMAKLPNEDADVWRLCNAVEDITGISVTYIGLDKTPWDIFFDVKYIGNTRIDPCSDRLKRQVMRDYILERHKPGEATLYLGIGAYEIDRTLVAQRRWTQAGYKVRFPLVDLPQMNRDYMMQWCRNMVGFVPRLYELGFDHNNCGGGCVKAGHKQWAKLWWYSRQGVLKTHEGIPTFNWWRDNEAKFRVEHGKNVSILRDWKNKGKPLSLTEFEHRLEAKLSGFLPGFGSLMMGWQDFERELGELDETPGCAFCDAAA